MSICNGLSRATITQWRALLRLESCFLRCTVLDAEKGKFLVESGDIVFSGKKFFPESSYGEAVFSERSLLRALFRTRNPPQYHHKPPTKAHKNGLRNVLPRVLRDAVNSRDTEPKSKFLRE